MLSLILAIFSSAAISLLMRLSESRSKSSLGMLAMNYLMCTALSALFSPWGQLAARDLGVTALFGLGNGVLYLASFALLQHSVRKNGVVLSGTFMKLGLLVTMAVSVCFFGEQPEPMQLVGFVLAVAAIVLINYQKGASSGGFRSGLLLLLFCGGMADAMSKVFEQLGPGGCEDPFLLFTFLTALALCLVLAKGQKPGVWDVVFGLGVGIPNFFSTRFLLLALEALPGVVVFPVYSVGTILVVTLAGVTLFRERLTSRRWLALAMILAALVLLNL